MITIELLKNHSGAIPRCAEIWHEVLGKIWIPETSVEQLIQELGEQLNEDILPITFVAFDSDKPVGMCSLCGNDGIRPDLIPWLASLVVDRKYQKKGIGRMLINAIKNKAKALNFKKLYLFAFERTISDYYARLGWIVIGMDKCEGHPVIVMEIGL